MGGFQRGWGEDSARGTGGPTVPPRHSSWPDFAPVEPALLTLADANAKARRSFWRGWLAGVFVAVLVVAFNLIMRWWLA